MDWLLNFDYSTFRAIHVGLHEPWLDPVFWVITCTGLGWVETLLSFFLLASKSTRPYLVPLWASMFVSGFIVADGTKSLLHRERPSNLIYAHPQESIYFSSYPSGHTSLAFGAAFMLLFLTWGTPRAIWGRLAVVWAVLVGVSRVYRGVHWPTDALAGMFVGLFSASAVYWATTRFGSGRGPDRPSLDTVGRTVG
ncbi:MAG TPA: phosphatase PAP2 family protein [Fimbriimonas sp.]|nr:phosphatase PAP2 family protein [Fimbriimonas sp.]